MTKPIPCGTANVTFNVLEDERALWDRIAPRFSSRGEMFRALLLKAAAIEFPAVAAEIQAVRLRYGRHAAAAVMLAVGILSVGQSWFDGHDLRRAKGRTHCAKLVKKTVKRGTEVEEG